MVSLDLVNIRSGNGLSLNSHDWNQCWDITNPSKYNLMKFYYKFKIKIEKKKCFCEYHLKGLVQDCSNSSALAMELLQSCPKLLIHKMVVILLSPHFFQG